MCVFVCVRACACARFSVSQLWRLDISKSVHVGERHGSNARWNRYFVADSRADQHVPLGGAHHARQMPNAYCTWSKRPGVLVLVGEQEERELESVLG